MEFSWLRASLRCGQRNDARSSLIYAGGGRLESLAPQLFKALSRETVKKHRNSASCGQAPLNSASTAWLMSSQPLAVLE
jgi:hypothetical protein